MFANILANPGLPLHNFWIYSIISQFSSIQLQIVFNTHFLFSYFIVAPLNGFYRHLRRSYFIVAPLNGFYRHLRRSIVKNAFNHVFEQSIDNMYSHRKTICFISAIQNNIFIISTKIKNVSYQYDKLLTNLNQYLTLKY